MVIDALYRMLSCTITRCLNCAAEKDSDHGDDCSGEETRSSIRDGSKEEKGATVYVHAPLIEGDLRTC